MTRAAFARREGGYEISVTGHADYAGGGKDIVCAACSVLAWVFVRLFHALEDRDKCTLLREVVEPGDVRLTVYPAPGARGEIETLVEVMASGYQELAEQYPENVSHTWETDQTVDDIVDTGHAGETAGHAGQTVHDARERPQRRTHV